MTSAYGRENEFHNYIKPFTYLCKQKVFEDGPKVIVNVVLSTHVTAG